MIQYIPGDIFRASLKFCMGDNLREKMGGGVKGTKHFSVHLNVHTPMQIVFLKLNHAPGEVSRKVKNARELWSEWRKERGKVNC
jgi:hypothetical protein